jgi:hypothetical protein
VPTSARVVSREVTVSAPLEAVLAEIVRPPLRSFPPAPAEPRDEILANSPERVRLRRIEGHSIINIEYLHQPDGSFRRKATSERRGRLQRRLEVTTRLKATPVGTAVSVEATLEQLWAPSRWMFWLTGGAPLKNAVNLLMHQVQALAAPEPHAPIAETSVPGTVPSPHPVRPRMQSRLLRSRGAVRRTLRVAVCLFIPGWILGIAFIAQHAWNPILFLASLGLTIGAAATYAVGGVLQGLPPAIRGIEMGPDAVTVRAGTTDLRIPWSLVDYEAATKRGEWIYLRGWTQGAVEGRVLRLTLEDARRILQQRPEGRAMVRPSVSRALGLPPLG